MKSYLIRRLILIPLTLFAIVLVNFVILNLAPLDPSLSINRSASEEASRSDKAGGENEEQYLLFREHYGLTLPILFNYWPSISKKKLETALATILEKKESAFSESQKLKSLWSDRAKFLVKPLLEITGNSETPLPIRQLSLNFLVRAGTRHGFIGPRLNVKEKEENRKIAKDNQFLFSLKVSSLATASEVEEKLHKYQMWQGENTLLLPLSYTFEEKVKLFFFQTRFFRYLKRVVTLDFGTLRNDHNKLVVKEVVKRVKYSLTLSLLPMFLTFLIATSIGLLMAFYQNTLLDISLNTFLLILFSIPAFVAAPFLIEKIALKASWPTSGFHSEERVYEMFTSFERLKDISFHLILPLISIIYAMIAIQARLSRTAMLDVLKQDHVKTAYAKGLPLPTLLLRHVCKNGSIPLVTSLASSLGLILGGSLIIETVFEINGFGRFFYDAVINRDYNVVLFSAFAGSILTLFGYLIADICYTLLDPRIRFI